MIGQKDTCLHMDTQGKQPILGICCTDKRKSMAWHPGFGFISLQPQHPGLSPFGQSTFPPSFHPGIQQPGFSGKKPESPGIESKNSSTVSDTFSTASTSSTTTVTTSSFSGNDDFIPTIQPQCGIGGNPIAYNTNGEDIEARQRITREHPLRVVNGWPSDKNEWPWIAALLRSGRQFCGGSLIDERHILTAAHCVAQMSSYDVSKLTIRLGDHDIRSKGETKIFESNVARVVRHKGFSSETLYHDVALITLENPVPASFNATIRPVCLVEGSERYEGKLATVIGWGSLYERGPQPSILQELTMEIWNNDKCKQLYGEVAPAGIQEHMMCAGQKGKDSCSGDSGGPLHVPIGQQWYQIGIVSWGIGCGKADYPGVYTRVTDTRKWIEKVSRRF